MGGKKGLPEEIRENENKNTVHDFLSFKTSSFKHCRVKQARYFLYANVNNIHLLQCEFLNFAYCLAIRISPI